MAKLLFVTGSPEKFREASLVLPELQRIDIDLPEIQELDQKKILEAKLKAAAGSGHSNIIVEDTGLYFKSLKYSLPGPLIKWFVKGIGNQGLIDLAGEEGADSEAYALTTLGYLASPDSEAVFFEGRLDGRMVSPRGSGFGWDAIFQPTISPQTLGEMNIEQKTALSHRGAAFRQLAAHLKLS